MTTPARRWTCSLIRWEDALDGTVLVGTDVSDQDRPTLHDEFIVVAMGSDEDDAKSMLAALRAARILAVRENCAVASAPFVIPAFPVVTWLVYVRHSDETSARAVIRRFTQK
jgi:hypothetical protein